MNEILITETIEIKLSGRIVDYYESKGYKIPRIKNSKGKLVIDKSKTIEVKVEDLPLNSTHYIEVLCDYCKKNKHIKPYLKYNKQRQIIQKDCCFDCQREKFKESMLSKYGVDSYSKTEEGKKKVSENKTIHTIEECKILFKERGYILLENEYINNSTHMQYLCKKHKEKGVLKITLGKLLLGRGCVYCSNEIKGDSQRHSHEQVVEIIESQSGCKLLSDTYTRYKERNLEIRCFCGNTFTTSLEFFNLGKQRCDECTNKKSSSEKVTEDYLLSKNIIFDFNKTLPECRYDNLLQFDFIICKHNKIHMVLELDGQQHFKPVRFGGMSYENAEKQYIQNIERDKIKNQYCKDNNIPLIRIPYWQFDRIEQILDKWLKKYELI